jgi:hypothetical protein
VQVKEIFGICRKGTAMNLINRMYFLSTLAVIILFASLMFGCDRGPNPQKAQTNQSTPTAQAAKADSSPQSSLGKYLRKNNPQDYTELNSDGTFLIYQRDYKGSGKYKIDGTRLILTLKSGVVVEGKIEAKTITDNRGNVWEKQ